MQSLFFRPVSHFPGQPLVSILFFQKLIDVPCKQTFFLYSASAKIRKPLVANRDVHIRALSAKRVVLMMQARVDC